MLGANNLPLTFTDAKTAMQQYECELVFDHRTRETLQSIESYAVDFTERPFFDLILRSSFDIIPDGVLQKLQKTSDGCLRIQARRLALQVASQPVQWMLNEQGVSAVARTRVNLKGLRVAF